MELSSLLPLVVGIPSMSRGIVSWLGTRTVNRNIVVVGLKSDNHSREMLLRLLNSIVEKGDSVVAVHVRQSDDSFDTNTFLIHEDLCKTKKVDFEVKICAGSCYITELSHQVRVTSATDLVMGCSSRCLKDLKIAKCLKVLPPTCNLLVMDNGGGILLRKKGTSQQGLDTRVLQSSISSLSALSNRDKQGTRKTFSKSSSMPSSSTSQQTESTKPKPDKKHQELDDLPRKFSQKLAMSDAKEHNRRFSFEELNHGTKSFSPDMLIGEGGHSNVYRAILDNGQAVAVKVLKISKYSEENFFGEVKILSSLRHENIVRFLGYCHCEEMHAIVYKLVNSSLRQRLKQLKWSERMRVALDVAKALEYLHSFCPPIIHRDVNSSNILLSGDCKPQLSDFGAAIALTRRHQSSVYKKPIHVIGTFGYLAPEYMMYGKVDEKIDVYSYGVVLLELITGKEAIQTSSTSNQESLVLWARSLLTSGLFSRLIDPSLNGDYNKDEMQTMMTAARLCLLQSSTGRPTINTIFCLLEEPNCSSGRQKKMENLLSHVVCEDESSSCRRANSDHGDMLRTDDA